MADYQKYFPIFRKRTIYFDNASTTQKPVSVMNAVMRFQKQFNANSHRGLYPLASNASSILEETRQKTAEFLNIKPKEVVFTSSTTDSLNRVKNMLFENYFSEKKAKITISKLEHNANLLPWLSFKNADFSFIDVDKNFQLANIHEIKNQDIICITLASNVTGSVVSPQEIKTLRKNNPNAFIVLDIAQAISHFKIDLKKLNVDFAAFSTHKIYGPMGLGVLFIKENVGKNLKPFFLGGGIVNNVDIDIKKTEFKKSPQKFEAGSLNLEAIYGFKTTLEFIEKQLLGFDNIETKEQFLRKYLFEKLKTIDEVEIYHPPLSINAIPTISFNVKGVHPHDLTEYLGTKKICLRGGNHCASLFHKEVLGKNGSIRASLCIYNTKKEIDYFVKMLYSSILVFR